MSPSAESMSGFDPFDALRGDRVPAFVKRNQQARQVVIQLRKRARKDLGALLGVQPFLMAKTVGAFLAAEARSVAAGRAEADPSSVAEILLGDPTIARGRSGEWGYEFDVQTRWAYYPAHSANMIATVFVARGLLEAGLVCGEQRWRDAHDRAARYIDTALRAADGSLHYTPDSSTLVHNANLIGAGTLAVAGVLGGDDSLTDHGLQAAVVSIHAQREDGSWPYGDEPGLAWCDNFHTAYNLDGLLSVWLCSGDHRVESALAAGCEQWTTQFFSAEGAPAYFAGGGAPYDVHCAGTAIDVAARLSMHGFDTLPLARSVAAWTRANLIAPDGTTYYRRTRTGVDRRHFVRWGDAHVEMGMASLALAEHGVSAPIDAALVQRGSR